MGEELDRDQPPEGQVITPSGQPKSARRPCLLEGGCSDRGQAGARESGFTTLSPQDRISLWNLEQQ